MFSSCVKPQEQKSHRLVGGPCEGCEAVFEYGNKNISSVDTLPGFSDAKQKLKITGTIYMPDGKTPAQNVILYVYHTNEEGMYVDYGNESGWGKRHGSNRGWIKTGKDGRYTFYTSRPGTYPTRDEPAHIHPVILEPNGKYFWIDEYLFDDDPLLTEEGVSNSSPRGGSGVMILEKEGDLFVGKRDIILGANVPDYE